MFSFISILVYNILIILLMNPTPAALMSSTASLFIVHASLPYVRTAVTTTSRTRIRNYMVLMVFYCVLNSINSILGLPLLLLLLSSTCPVSTHFLKTHCTLCWDILILANITLFVQKCYFMHSNMSTLGLFCRLTKEVGTHDVFLRLFVAANKKTHKDTISN